MFSMTVQQNRVRPITLDTNYSLQTIVFQIVLTARTVIIIDLDLLWTTYLITWCLLNVWYILQNVVDTNTVYNVMFFMSPGDAAADQLHPAGAHRHEPREATHCGHHLPVQQEVLWRTQACENDFDKFKHSLQYCTRYSSMVLNHWVAKSHFIFSQPSVFCSNNY